MSINLDVIIDTPDYSVDMKSGLETLQGASDTTRCIAETILTNKVVKRKGNKSKVRTTLRSTFKGSYGQIFSLELYDSDLTKRLNKITRGVFFELFSYFIKEALYLESEKLSLRAEKVLDELGEEAEELIEILRLTSLENLHSASNKFSHKVVVNHRKSKFNKIMLGSFDKETGESLKAKEENEKYDLVVAITRLNINTGNGRLLVEGEDDTVAFGFSSQYKQVKIEAKKFFSKNLDYNNGLESDGYKYLKVVVSPVKLNSGKIVKYLIKGFYNE
ncbi:hypothetical protein SAMN05421509_107263 [Chromohalobacter canadensis]|uniref:Uncharacterized protein n=1 Tax=Chromohalobacter canadensis TaxID=141389 RepID=A0A285VU96_9GAMM|nr:hypothetical protein [Chromohalobacter canadensis]SOC56796.1 hypothetical protein SAMN05421509_107263 [Chromohalobacter canadensis]